MHTSFFKSLAVSLAAHALGVSVATTPAFAHGGGGGEVSTAASAAEASMAASAADASVAALATEGSVAASPPITAITAVMTIAATATGTMATETASRISPPMHMQTLGI